MATNSLAFFPLRIGVYGPSPWIWEPLWLFWRTEYGRSNALWFLQLGRKKLHSFCFVGWNILSWILRYGLRSWLPWGHMLERPQGEVTWQSPENEIEVCVFVRERENKRPRASSHSNHTSPDTRHEHDTLTRSHCRDHAGAETPFPARQFVRRGQVEILDFYLSLAITGQCFPFSAGAVSEKTN